MIKIRSGLKVKEREVVLITGCNSGLGRALATQLMKSPKYKLVITAREKSLQQLKEFFPSENEHLLVRKLDVTEESEISTLINEVCRLWGGIDILVNNAGVCYRSVVEHMDLHSEMIQLKTNYLAPMSLIRSVLPIMREQGGGKIINVSSVSGMVSMPTMASYSASKHALEGASEALWYEAKPYGIKVTLVEPGFINSESYRHVLYSKKAELSNRLNGPHSEYYKSMAPFIEKLMSWTFDTPEKIALKMERLMRMSSPPLRARVTWDAKIFALVRKILPSNLFHWIMFLCLPGTKWWGISVLERRKMRKKIS